MAHVVLDLPEPKSALDASLTKQFTQIQQQLMQLIQTQQREAQTMRTDFLDTLEQFVKQMLARPTPFPDHSDALVQAIRELRQVIQQRPQSLGASSGNGSAAGTIRPHITVTPKVTVQIPGAITKRLDSMESALLEGLRRSRSRTFGSNY